MDSKNQTNVEINLPGPVELRSLNSEVGLGSHCARIAICIPHVPESIVTENLNTLMPVMADELAVLTAECGNHWRKIITLSAKLAFALEPAGVDSWQAYRDHRLCHGTCPLALLFSLPKRASLSTDRIHIISGHRYCETLFPGLEFERVSADFRVNRSFKIIDSPYFDYRQLSNVKLEQLLELIKGFGESVQAKCTKTDTETAS